MGLSIDEYAKIIYENNLVKFNDHYKTTPLRIILIAHEMEDALAGWKSLQTRREQFVKNLTGLLYIGYSQGWSTFKSTPTPKFSKNTKDLGVDVLTEFIELASVEPHEAYMVRDKYTRVVKSLIWLIHRASPESGVRFLWDWRDLLEEHLAQGLTVSFPSIKLNLASGYPEALSVSSICRRYGIINPDQES